MPRRTDLSLDLLCTFVTLLRRNGNAASAARDLGINQPSMSKRLGFLQHAGPVLERPWLEREGKTWRLTEEGARVLPAVQEIVERYEQLRSFTEQPGGPQVHFGCGQEAAVTFVAEAAQRFHRQRPDVRLRLGTRRGEARVVGVANGSLDLAVVSHDEQAIYEKARRHLHVQTLFKDPLVLACAAGPWRAAVEELPDGRVKPRALVGLPLILPESDAGVRKGFDSVLRAKGLLHSVNVVMELGGWSAILAYVRLGLGVGVVSASAAEKARKADDRLVVRALAANAFEPIQMRLIARRQLGAPDQADLSPEAREFHDVLVAVTEPLRQASGSGLR